MSATASSLPGKIADRYVVERELGRGATSVVYLARDLDLGRMVALKVLRQELAESIAADRFTREIQLTAQLHHPNVVPVLSSGVHEGRLYFALPYMDGGTLRERLQRDKQLPIDDVVKIGVTVARALAFAHERNLLHRDVKPENILFTNGEACLSDFGIAKAITRASDESTTTTGLVRGTPAYMSPEQAAGDRDYDGRSDVYSLACVLYEAVAGVPAFVGATPQAVVAQRITHEPRAVSVYRPSVPPGIEAVLKKALALAPADRYQTAAEFASALERGTSAVPATRSSPANGLLVAAAIIIAGIALITLPRSREWIVGLRAAPLDTTRIAVLSAGLVSDSASARMEELVGEGLRRWRPLELVEGFEVADAVRRLASRGADERSVARSLGAGRYVRAHQTRRADTAIIDASIVDAGSGTLLHTARVVVPLDSLDAVAPYRRLADSLLLRGQRPSGLVDTAETSGNLPATQLMLAAQASLREWDLSAAESLYARALEVDPTATRAALWIAQLRAWQKQPRDGWRALATQAVANARNLSGSEAEMARALAALGASDYPRACASYRLLVRRNEQSFIAWYGLAHCLEADDIVMPVRDARRWRFRSSYNEALNAYVHAFDLGPSVYRSYQGNAFEQLRALLYTNARALRIGRLADAPTQLYTAQPMLVHDTLEFAIQPIAATMAGKSVVDTAAATRWLERSRAVFRRIALGWTAALPKNPGAKEALAVSLELDQDRASIDSVRSLLGVANDDVLKLRLLSSLIWLELKFDAPDSVASLASVRRAADSVLHVPHVVDARHAQYLTQIATLTGDCGTLAAFMRAAAMPSRQLMPVPRQTAQQSEVVGALTAMGCPVTGRRETMDAIVRSLNLTAQPVPIRDQMQNMLLARILRLSDSVDSRWATALAAGDPMIRARLYASRHLVDSARYALGASHGVSTNSPTPDVIFPESRILLALGDTAGARRRLDEMFASSRGMPPFSANQALDASINIATFIRAMALRGAIAESPAARERWRRAAVALWPVSPERFPSQRVP